MEISNNEAARKEVFCRYIHRNGRIIYPKNAQFFHFWIEETRSTHGSNGANTSKKAKRN